MVAQDEPEVNALLDGCGAQCGQPVDLRLSPWLGAELSERLTTPQRQGVLVEGDRFDRGVPIRLTARVPDQPDEPVGIHALGIDVEQVSGTPGDHRRFRDAGITESVTQPRDAPLQGIRGVGRQLLTPECVHQRAGRDDPSGVEREHLQHCPFAARRQGANRAVDDHLERPEDAQLHDASRCQ
ncbi:MAG TPA: hypothetical protein VFH03_09070 [Actinoplanes sp.]|nr:hypothetical protein [Actinoplanes sp.]